jgi:hypothetical protein
MTSLNLAGERDTDLQEVSGLQASRGYPPGDDNSSEGEKGST